MSSEALERAAAHGFLPGLRGGRARLRFDRRLGFGAVGALAAAAAIAWYGWSWWETGRFVETTDDAYVGGDVTTLAPHVAGFVAKLLVADNQPVKKGQLLIELDDRDYRAKLAHAEAAATQQTAALADLRAKSDLQQSLIAQAEADLAAERATAGYAREDAARYHALAVTSYGSVQNDQKASAADRKAAAAVRAGEAGLAAAKQQLAVLDGEIAETRAGLAAAQADLHAARLDLGYTRIYSPIDGYVGNRAAQIGAYASVGAALLSIVPAHALWVDANFKEDQLAHMHAGQPATIVTDVLPGRKFAGRVLSVAPATGAVFSVIPPENATGNFTKIVQRVPVRIAILDGAASLGPLRPGLSATVRVDTRVQ